MNIKTRRFNLIISMLLWLPVMHSAQAEPLLGLTLQKTTINDVKNLITQSGAQITEDHPLLGRDDRVIRIQGGSLPGVRDYIRGSFIFNDSGVLDTYFLVYTLSTPGIFNERFQALSSNYGQPKKHWDGSIDPHAAMFPIDVGDVRLYEDQTKNELMETWEVNSLVATRPEPVRGNSGGGRCESGCDANYNACMRPSPIGPAMSPISTNFQQNLAVSGCNARYQSCLNQCAR